VSDRARWIELFDRFLGANGGEPIGLLYATGRVWHSKLPDAVDAVIAILNP
jgi:hypothetical protein